MTAFHLLQHLLAGAWRDLAYLWWAYSGWFGEAT